MKINQCTTSSNECAQCGNALIAPDWSEYRGARCIRHLWTCEACGYVYETIVYLAPEFCQADAAA